MTLWPCLLVLPSIIIDAGLFKDSFESAQKQNAALTTGTVTETEKPATETTEATPAAETEEKKTEEETPASLSSIAKSIAPESTTGAISSIAQTVVDAIPAAVKDTVAPTKSEEPAAEKKEEAASEPPASNDDEWSDVRTERILPCCCRFNLIFSFLHGHCCL